MLFELREGIARVPGWWMSFNDGEKWRGVYHDALRAESR